MLCIAKSKDQTWISKQYPLPIDFTKEVQHLEHYAAFRQIPANFCSTLVTRFKKDDRGLVYEHMAMGMYFYGINSGVKAFQCENDIVLISKFVGSIPRS